MSKWTQEGIERGRRATSARRPIANAGCPIDEPLVAFQQLQTLEKEAEKGEVTVPRVAPDVDVLRDPHAEVLIVEDDEDEVRIIDRALRRHDMASRAKIVRSGEDALAYLQAASVKGERGPPRPKIVILDLKLPGIGGQDVLRQIRADDRLCTLPVVIVSSSRSAKDVCACYRLGANSFVEKPLQRDHPGDHVLQIARYWLELNRAVPAS